MSDAYSAPDEQELDEMRAEDQSLRRYFQRLFSHPDCRDPDHPGCPYCWPTEESEDE
jgi:hypothetical protein